MNKEDYTKQIQETLDDVLLRVEANTNGKVANYIPELSNVGANHLACAVQLTNGEVITSGASIDVPFTLQSVSKLILLIGLLEDFGPAHVFSLVDVEPSGQPFASVAQQETIGPIPSNPLVNSGAIVLAAHLPGSYDKKIAWIEKWLKILFGEVLISDEDVFSSELQTGNRNRSIAYLLKGMGVINTDVEEVLNIYFRLCSYKATASMAVKLAALLANGGINTLGDRVFKENTCNSVIAVMATCGLYDDSGKHLVRCGIPAKSGVSGAILGVATGRGGICTYSPRLNEKGTSVRGYKILTELSRALEWHFAAPWGYTKIR